MDGVHLQTKLGGKALVEKDTGIYCLVRKLIYRFQYPDHIGICGTAGAGNAFDANSQRAANGVW